MFCLKRVISVLTAFLLVTSLSVHTLADSGIRDGKTSDTTLSMINALRKKAGLNSLTLDKDLAEAAQIRVLENAERQLLTHSRPNGQKFFSVSTKAWGENAAFGYTDERSVFDAFSESPGHREIILDRRFSIVGYACAEDADGIFYWIYLFGTGSSNMSWAMRDWGVRTFTLDPFNNPNTPMDKAGVTQPAAIAGNTVNPVDKDGGVISAALNAELEKSIADKSAATASVRIKNAASVSTAALESFADAAAQSKRTAIIIADTMRGKSVQGRIILEPSRLSGLKSAIRLGIRVDSDSIAPVKTAMEQRYSNKMAYIHMEHRGSLAVDTRVIAKVDLAGLDINSLMFYIYGSSASTLIDNPRYSIDKNGYLWIYTKTAGDIIITDRPLEP